MSELRDNGSFQNEVLLELLNQWRSVSNVEKRGILALAKEIDLASQLVEVSVDNLSGRFLELALLAKAQSGRIIDFSKDADQIEYLGNKIGLAEVFAKFDNDISENLDRLITLSKKSVSLSYTLEDTDDRLQSLLISAKAGDEIEVDEIQSILDDVRASKNELGDIASIDLSDKIEQKDRICEFLKNVISQNEEIEKVLDKTASEAETLTAHVGEIITQMQFQDRTNQRLAHVSTTLRVIVDMLVALEKEAQCVDGVAETQDINRAWVEKIISDMNLGEIRERFVKLALLEGNENILETLMETEEEIAHSSASDDIELF